jgi:hypothetical protein
MVLLATINVLLKKFEKGTILFSEIRNIYMAALIIGFLFGCFLYILSKRKNDIYVMNRLRYCIIYGCLVCGVGMTFFYVLYMYFMLGYHIFLLFISVWFIVGGFIVTNVIYTIKEIKEKKRMCRTEK